MIKFFIYSLKFILGYLFLASCFLALIPVVSASGDLAYPSKKIASYPIPGLIKEDGTGLFNQLNDAIFNEIKIHAELSISSMNRSRRSINNGDIDAFFPELWENLPGDKEQYVVSNPIFYKRILLFTQKGSGLSKLSDFKGKILGAVEGFSYGEAIKSDPDLIIEYQDNDITNIKLLLNNKISGVLGGYPGTVGALKKNIDAHKVQYDIHKPVAILESFYVCKNDIAGVKLCKAINEAISVLLQKGILELNPTTGVSRFNPPKNK